jgi:hypothetical protein
LSSEQLCLGLVDTTHSREIQEAVDQLASSNDSNTRGAIFTRREVANFILDLVGYTKDQPLYHKRILEPSFGNGDFLLPIIDRLLSSWQDSAPKISVIDELSQAICAIELHRDTFNRTFHDVVVFLETKGIEINIAIKLARIWLLQGDFLLTSFDQKFDFAVGNPPYIRQELIPTLLLNEYRNRYKTMYDRADIYIAFIEKSLRLLSNQGYLGIICADRWMKNRYGAPLRKLIDEHFHLNIYVDMVDTPAFQSNVISYPAITIISQEIKETTRIVYRPQIDHQTLSTLTDLLNLKILPKDQYLVKELSNVTNGSDPWLLESFDQLALIRRIENTFPLLEEVGCIVGIGVATGADQAFIGNFEKMDVEEDRKIPLVMTKDILSGEVKWQGKAVINPFNDLGKLVNLSDYPKLKSYLEERKTVISNRYCAKKKPNDWYCTIDCIHPNLMNLPKLLIPDIKGDAHVVFEEGKRYPHHNLYYVISEEWHLRALQAVLLSSITKLFITNYSTKMNGGYLRFQAQYLRRIRLPKWQDVPEYLKNELIEGAIKRDIHLCDQAVFKLYQLNNEEQLMLKIQREIKSC